MVPSSKEAATRVSALTGGHSTRRFYRAPCAKRGLDQHRAVDSVPSGLDERDLEGHDDATCAGREDRLARTGPLVWKGNVPVDVDRRKPVDDEGPCADLVHGFGDARARREGS